MKVLILHRGGDLVRGTEETLLTLLSEADSDKYQFKLVCNNKNFVKHLQDSEIDATQIVLPEIILKLRNPQFDLFGFIQCFRTLSGIIKNYKPDILLASGGHPCQQIFFLSRYFKLPSLCYYHHPVPAYLYRNWLIKYVDKIIYASHSTREDVENVVDISGKVIYYGLDLEQHTLATPEQRIQERAKLGLTEDDIVITQIGALVGNKRVELLIDTVAEIVKEEKNVKLFIIGHGVDHDKLSQKIEDLHLQDVVFLLGYVDDIFYYLRYIVDINVLASLIEGLGLSLIQASLYKIPNVCTNSTGMKEAVIDHETGLLFDTEDKQAFRDCLLSLIKNSQLRQQYGENGRAFVQKTFNREDYIKHFCLELESLVAD